MQTASQKQRGVRRRKHSYRWLFWGRRFLDKTSQNCCKLFSSGWRFKNLLWLAGFDRFPFRERGWVLLVVISILTVLSIWSFNPSNLEIYKNWRSKEHFNRAVSALESGRIKTAQIYLRNAYRHSPNNFNILRKWLETIPKNDLDQRIAIMLQILSLKPSGEVAADVVDELIENQKIDAAAAFATRQLTLHPESGRLWFAAGKSFLLQRRLDVARDALEKAKKYCPNDRNIDFHIALLEILTTPPGKTPNYSAIESFQDIPELRTAVSRTLTALYLINDQERANYMLEQIVSENPGDWEYIFLLFRLKLYRSTQKDDLLLWDNIWSKANSTERRFAVIFEAINNKLYEVAQTLIARLSNEDRKLVSYKWLQFIFLINHEQSLEALSIAKSALQDTNLSIDWQLRFFVGMALAQDKLGNKQESYFSFNEAIRRVKDQPQLSFYLSELLLSFNLLEYARDSFERTAAFKSPFEEPALRMLLNIYTKQLDWDATLKTLERLHQLDPSNNHYTLQLCTMLLVNRNINHPLIKILIQNDFDSFQFGFEVFELIAHAHAQSGNLQKAASLLKKADSQFITPKTAGINRIATLAYLGKKEEAATAFSQLLESPQILFEREKKYLLELTSR